MNAPTIEWQKVGAASIAHTALSKTRIAKSGHQWRAVMHEKCLFGQREILAREMFPTRSAAVETATRWITQQLAFEQRACAAAVADEQGGES